MKKPWLKWSALAMALSISGFVACNSQGGIAGQCGGMMGCGSSGASNDNASACNTAGGIWNGTFDAAHRCTKEGKSNGTPVSYTSTCK